MGGQWTDLWTTATTIDFRLAAERNESALMAALASDDGLELALRRLSSFIYEKRTGDYDVKALRSAKAGPATVA